MKRLRNQRSLSLSKKRNNRKPSAAARLAKICELLERREMLTGSPAYLAGAVVDSNNNPLTGAVVTLYPHGNDTPSAALASVTTGADGKYLFTPANAGATFVTGAEYDVIETPASGYANASTQGFTQVSTLVGHTANSFDVQIPSPAAVTVSVSNTFGPGNTYNDWDVITWQAGSGAFDSTTNTYSTYTTDPNSPETIAQYPATVNGNNFLTLCTNPDQLLAAPAGSGTVTNQFSVLPTTDFSPSVYGDRIAYLYNKYGTLALTGTDGPALQLAVYTLLLDAGGNLDTGTLGHGGFTLNDFNSGTSTLSTQNFINPLQTGGYAGSPYSTQNPSSPDYVPGGFAAEEQRAVDLINESFGQTSRAWNLPVDKSDPIQNGDQSIIGRDSFNFTNLYAPSITTTPGGTVSIGNITIGGTKYVDLTGNGFSADDTPDRGVTINLYQETNSSSGLQTGSGGDELVATTTTANDGTYSFGLTAAGTYYVQEAVPPGDVQTGGGPNGSAGNTYYTVVATSGHSYGGNNFDDFQVPTCAETNVSYTVTTPGGQSTTVTDLAGNTQPGDTVTVNFSVPSGSNDTLTLVSYYAQSASFSSSNAHQQLIYQQDTGTFAPGGPYSLTVTIPNTYYQIDFVCGAAIDQLEPNQNNDAYGPDSAEILYHAEQRFIASDSGGATAGTANTGSPIIPVPTTTPSTATAPLTDSATLSGGYSPTGTITFYLFAPGVTPAADNSNNVYSDAVTISGNGTYTTSQGANPGGYLATLAGTYQWVAVYSGDGNNTGATSPFGSEPETVGPVTPTISTTPGETTTVVGSGQYATIGFWHNKNGQAVIDNFDSGPSSTLLGNSLAANYPNLFGFANPYTSASLGASAGTAPGLAGLTNAQVAAVYLNLWTPSGLQKNTYVQAFAVAFGGYTTSGGATFNVGGNGAAFGVANNTSLTVAQILQDVSNNFNPTTGLFYGGDATLTSDANNVLNGINTSGENSGGGSTVSVSYLNDSATLAGGDNETGTITFYLMGPGATDSTPLTSAVYTDAVTVNGDGTYSTPSDAYLPTATGTYEWVAVYSGDANNNTVTSPFGSEPWTVGTQSPMITTNAGGAIVLGSGNALTDSATLSNGAAPTGTITFYLFAPTVTPNATDSNNVYSDVVTVSGNSTYTTSQGSNPGGYVPTVTGTYQWVAVYSGDGNNDATASNFGDEPETASPATPTIKTTPGGTVSVGNITINGAKFLDLTGNGFSADDTPLGGVTINLYQGGTGPSTAGDTLVATTTTAGDGTYSFGISAAGTYYVQESVSPGYLQTGGGPNGSAGNTYYTVVATAGNSYSGYNFDDFQVPTCAETNVSYTVTTPGGSSQTVSGLAGNTAQGDTVSVNFTVPAGMSDQLTLVSYVAPSSSFSDSNAYQQQIYQQATGTFAPGGPYTLTVKIPDSYYQVDFVCGAAITQLEPKNGSYGPDSAEILYHVENRFISGDNGGTTAPSSGALNSQVLNAPVLTTTSTPTAPLTDSATLSGGYSPGGTITFYLFAPGVTPNGTDSNSIYSDTVTVNGNGTYMTSQGNNPGGYVPSAAGTYQWVAVYSGDSNNSGTASPFGSEPETVSPTSSSITTTPGCTVVLDSGSKLTDSATLSGGVSPTGTITFYLFAPNVTPNAPYSNNVYSDTVTVNGNGTYTTSKGTNPGGYAPTVTGTYEWLAVYSGDSNNMQLVSTFGDEPESVVSGSPLGAGGFATIGFWHNKNGQAVIDSFNGGSTQTELGTWLATSFPNLFGASNPYISSTLASFQGSPTTLAGLTNAQIAKVYENLWTPSGVTKNTYVQAFAVALGMYADNSALGYDSTAAKYGFKSVSGGGGSETYNVGSNGAAFGVANNSRLPILQLLQIVDANFSPSTGTFYAGNSTDTTDFNNVLNGINTTGDITNAATVGAPGAGSGTVVYSTDQIRTAYGVSNLALDGTGQTIAIVDAYDNPNIFQSLDSFDQQMSTTTGGASLFTQYGSAASFLTVIGQDGTTTDLPATDPTGAWETEIALDVEWIHALAPGAQIVLVEANSQSLADLMASVGTAASQPGVSVVSMSWGFTEGQSVLAADEAKYDSYLTTPAGHQGVTFVASTGDYGAADPEYPAFSPNVVAVGGTSLYLNADNSYNSETGWGYYSDAMGVAIGGGGGVSLYEPEPAFQQGAQSTGYRTTPDVSFVADPATGAWVADTYNLGATNPWEIVGGTSLAAPSWAAVIALADQARVVAGGQTLGSAGPTETQQALYTLPVTDFNAITTGSNGYSAGPGYNLVGGLGTPIANLLVNDLAAYAGSTAVPAGRIALSGAEATLSNTNFGATNALTGVANAFAVVNVELASGLVFHGEVESRGSSSDLAQALQGLAAEEPLIAAPSAMPAGASVVSGLGAGTAVTSAASPSIGTAACIRRSPLGGALGESEALDTLFASDGADLTDFAADELLPSTFGEGSDGSAVAATRSVDRPSQTSAGDAEAITSTPSAPAPRANNGRPAPSATAAMRTLSAGENIVERGASAEAAGWMDDPADRLAAAVDAVVEKSADVVGRAYESVVDAIFGLIG